MFLWWIFIITYECLGQRQGQNNKKSKWRTVKNVFKCDLQQNKQGKVEIVLIENNRWDIEVAVAEHSFNPGLDYINVSKQKWFHSAFLNNVFPSSAD